MIQFNWFDNPETEQLIKQNFIERLGSGGQGLCYKITINGKFHVLKFHEDLKAPERYKIIRERIQSIDRPVPPALKYRAFPIAEGRCNTQGIQSVVDDGPSRKADWIIHIFNWTDATELTDEEIWKRIPKSMKALKNLARYVVDALDYLDRIGIVHPDLYPDNFLLDDKLNIHMFDLEGVGILDDMREKMVINPQVIGKSFPGFVRPPESIPKSQNEPVDLKQITKYTPYWSGLMIVSWILLNRKSPFEFLTRTDLESLVKLHEIMDKTVRQWPPENIEQHPYLREDYVEKDYKKIKDFRNQFTKYPFSELKGALYLFFSKGWDSPKDRNGFRWIRRILGL